MRLIRQQIHLDHNMNPMSEMLDQRALQMGMVALLRLLNDLENQTVCDTMTEVSLLAGLAISQTRTSLCHLIFCPLTAHFSMLQGLTCVIRMPAVLRHNLSADDGWVGCLVSALFLNIRAVNTQLLS